MDIAAAGERRRRSDQRRPRLRGLAGTVIHRRRRHLRREADRTEFQYVDHYPPHLGLAVVALMCLCAADALCTLHIVGNGGSELNPVMQVLLDRGPRVFFLVKYVGTAICAAVLVAHSHLRLVRRLPVGAVLGLLLLGYFALVNYELLLLAGMGVPAS